MTARLPNFLHLGPGKSGSTWLHEVLLLHPDVFLTNAKDLYFFSRYYGRGLDWYRDQFARAPESAAIVGEVCPDYLASPQAPARIRECLGADVRFMVTLREPASRAFSAFLYRQKHGLAGNSFQEAVSASPDILDEGRYASQLHRYLTHFDKGQLLVALFDDLQADPQKFLDETTDWLGLGRQAISSELLEARLPASKARWLPAAKVAQRTAGWVRRHDGAELVGKIKRSALVQRSLYQPLGGNRPTMSPEDIAFIREQLGPEIAEVEMMFGLPLRERWQW